MKADGFRKLNTTDKLDQVVPSHMSVDSLIVIAQLLAS